MSASQRQPSLPGFEDQPDSIPERTAESENAPTTPIEKVEAPAGDLGDSTIPPDLTGKSVWVIDAHSLIHQVFHALPEMTGPQGQPVGAVFGFTRDVLYLLEEKKPDYLFAAFDLPGKTFRHDLYEKYKAQRPEMDVDLVPQIADVRRVLKALNVPAVDCPGYEADDVLAAVAKIVEQAGGDCYLITSDKDSRQLLTDHVKVFNIRKNELYDAEALMNDWGVAPCQVVDFQSLVGDSVDNVPGVPKVGPKSAQQLIAQHGTLEKVLDYAVTIPEKKRKKIDENLIIFREQALLSRQLVRLDADAPVVLDWRKGRAGAIDLTAALELCREFGFRGITQKITAVAKLQGQTSPGVELETSESGDESADSSLAAVPGRTTSSNGKSYPPPVYHLVNTDEAFAAFLDGLTRQTLISVDTETTDVRPRWAEIVGISFAWNEAEGWYLPLRCPADESHLDPKMTLDALRPILEDPKVEKIGQNLKYDKIVFRSAGIDVQGVAFDTMIASYLLDAGSRNHNLDELALHYLGHETIKISSLIGTGKNQKKMDEVPLRQIADYAAEDALIPMRLYPILKERLADDELEKLFYEVELPLIEVLVDIEFNGIAVDVAHLKELSRIYGERLVSAEDEILRLAGRPFNIASPKQLQEILFEELHLPVIKKTPKTGPSVDAEVLEELAPLHPLPAKLLEFRQYAKLKSTYVDALPELVFPRTGRVHASFNQVVTATGRLSSSDPNLQNIPVRNETGREIRAAFIPSSSSEAGGTPADSSDWVLLAADYSQIELRVLAHFSGDETLCAAFAQDEDIHALVAAQVNGIPISEVNPAMRRAAKAVNFGIVYGQSGFGLAKSLGIEQQAAQRFIDNYFARYPGIEKYLDQTLADCRNRGYVRTILGRRRSIQGIRERLGRQRNLAERTAVNTVIQGSAADLIKLAMIAVRRRLLRESFPARMLLQIHDELVFEVPASRLHDLAVLVSEEMAHAYPLNVPLKVDVKAGPNWASAESL